MLPPPSSWHIAVSDTLGIWALLSSLRFLRDNILNTDKLELVYLCEMGVSCYPFLATDWANPEFCPDIRLDLYWPGVTAKIAFMAAPFARSHASKSPGPFPFM